MGISGEAAQPLRRDPTSNGIIDTRSALIFMIGAE
jgi:hypothetical protein